MGESEKRMVHRNSRRWADIRQAARVARIEGVTLTLHRDGAVTVHREEETRSHICSNICQMSEKSVTTETHKPLQAEAASEARKKLPKASNEERLQRQQHRHQERLREHLKARACGERWQPLVQCLLRRSRAKFRCDVWTAHRRHKLALCEKWLGFVSRACAQQGARDSACDRAIARRARASARLRSLFSAYKVQHDRTAIQAMGRMCLQQTRLSRLLHGYVHVRNCEAAEDGFADEPTSSCSELSPPGRRISSCRHMNERTPPDDRGAKRAENRPTKTRGGRSRRR